MTEFTAEERYQARLIFEGKAGDAQKPCVHCGGVHLRSCRRVMEIQWHPDGSVIGAKYWHDGEWDDGNTVWPEDAYDEDDQPKEPVR